MLKSNTYLYKITSEVVSVINTGYCILSLIHLNIILFAVCLASILLAQTVFVVCTLEY